LSPWPIGAAVLGTFVALSIILRGSHTALQFMFIAVILAGLIVTWNRAKTRPAAPNQQPTTMSPGREQHTAVTSADATHPPVLKAEDAAAYLGVDVAEIIAEIQAGRMPGNRLGHRWLIRREALNAWLDGVHSGPESP
jgi:excisionase family DNA binding protein